ncbi:unnamed protein product [Merluccius merluccius]
MLFSIWLILLITPVPGRQTTAYEKSNSTGSDTIKSDAILTSSILKTVAALAKQNFPPKPNTANQTLLTALTVKQKPLMVNGTNSMKMKKASTTNSDAKANKVKLDLKAIHTASSDNVDNKDQHVNHTQTIKAPAVTSGVKDTEKPSSTQPIKIVISEGCDSSHTMEQDVKLKPGSPLVVTHKISLVPAGCSESCQAEMEALKARLDRLEKEMTARKDQCNCQNECPDCSKCAPGANCETKGDKGKFKMNIEAVPMKITEDKNTKAEQSISQKKDQTVTLTLPVKVSKVKTKARQQTAKTNIRDSAIARKTGQPTVGQILLKQKGKKQEEARIGRTTVLTGKELAKSEAEQVVMKVVAVAKAHANSGQLQDQPQTNDTLGVMKVTNGTAKILPILTKVMETSNRNNSLHPSTLAEKDVTQSPANTLIKKIKTGSVNASNVRSQYLVNATSVENRETSAGDTTTQQHTSRRSGGGLGSVKVSNVSSYSFTLTWSAPPGMFKNFTVIRREQRVEAEGTVEQEAVDRNVDSDDMATTAAKNMTAVQTLRENTDIAPSSVKATSSRGKAEERVSMVLPGNVRSVEFVHLQANTRYFLQVFGTAPGRRSKIHRISTTTGPEPATELVFSNVTESSVTLSWSKPKSTWTGFRVRYTNSITGESSVETVEPQRSHVVLSQLGAGSSYIITITSVQGNAESDALTSLITTVPSPPAQLRAVNVMDTRALLKWTPSLGTADRFIISYESAKIPNVTVTVMVSGGAADHQLRALQRGTEYTVKALSQKNGLQSAAASTTFTTASTVKASAVGPRSAVIKWSGTSSISYQRYKMTYRVAGEESKEVILDHTITEYRLTRLLPMTRYVVLIQGERDGQFTSIVTTEFVTGKLRFPCPADCSEEQLNGALQSGEVDIYPNGKAGGAYRVYCDMETDGGGWTVFQRRMNGNTDFYRTWNEYSVGFGNISQEFWLGNELLHNLTRTGSMGMRVDLRAENETAYAHYSKFTVDSEEHHYSVMLSGFTGTAGDSMRYHNGRPFSTHDKDPESLGIHCARAYMGGWWYKNCYKTNLNGLYNVSSNNQGVVWIDWKGKDSSLPSTEMKIRPAAFSPSAPHAQSRRSQRLHGGLPPGPPGLLLLGNLVDLSQKHLPSHLTGLAQRYGRIFTLTCGNSTLVVLNSNDLIKEALVKKWSDFAGRPISYTGDMVSGGGCSVSLGDYSEEWRAQRRLVHRSLQRCSQTSLHALIQKQALLLRKVLIGYNGSAVDLSEDFTVAASNVITALTFEKEYEKDSEELQRLHSCLNKIVSLWGSPWISALDSFPLLRKLPNRPFSRLLKEVARRDDIIGAHLNEFKLQDNKSEDSITDSLLKGIDQCIGSAHGVRLTATHLHMAAVDLLIGGTETTAAWLNWTVAFLLHRPEVQSQVYEEMCAVLEDRYPHYSDRRRLPLLSAVVSEVLRLRPVAPLAVPHRALRDSSIAGYFIPKDTLIIPNLFGAHHDPAVWTEPYCFRPERFLEGGGGCAGSLLAFGGGPRRCLGETVAKMELFLFTAYLLRDFQFVSCGEEAGLPDLEGEASVVLKVKSYKVIAVPRPVEHKRDGP